MPLSVNSYLVHGHIAMITETKSMYVMIKSTLQFHDIELKVKYMYVVKNAVTQAETKS